MLHTLMWMTPDKVVVVVLGVGYRQTSRLTATFVQIDRYICANSFFDMPRVAGPHTLHFRTRAIRSHCGSPECLKLHEESFDFPWYTAYRWIRRFGTLAEIPLMPDMWDVSPKTICLALSGPHPLPLRKRFMVSSMAFYSARRASKRNFNRCVSLAKKASQKPQLVFQG